MLRIFLLSLTISYMGFINLHSNEKNPQIEETCFNNIQQLMDQSDFFQAKEVLVQEISQNLLLSENFDYESFQNIKCQVFKKLTRGYESVPISFYQLFE